MCPSPTRQTMPARITVVSTFICPSDVGDDVFNLKNAIDEETEGTTVITRLAKSNYPGVFGTQDIHAICETGSRASTGARATACSTSTAAWPFATSPTG